MSYLHFIGIDVSKNVFDAACHDTPHRTAQFSNDAAGFKAFAKAFAAELPAALIVLEATGGYENALIACLAVKQRRALHRAHPLQAKHFIRSLGQKGKTDQLDAQALARYGAERHASLALWTPLAPEQQKLAGLMARRADLVGIRVAEENRLKHPRYHDLKPSLNAMLKTIETQIKAIETKVKALVEQAPTLKQKFAVITAIKGVGAQTAYALLADMPELGTMTRRQAASLAGLAPHPKDSGNTSRYRSTSGGRQTIRRALFMAAMAARTHNQDLKAFFLNLTKNGKKPMVALTAVMRKLITIINAKIRDDQPQLQHGR